MKIGKPHTICSEAIKDGSVNRTPVTANVAVAEVVDEKGDDIRALVFGKTGTDQHHEAKKCENGFHVISFWAAKWLAFFLGSELTCLRCDLDRKTFHFISQQCVGDKGAYFGAPSKCGYR
jgi:hypothetical protein